MIVLYLIKKKGMVIIMKKTFTFRAIALLVVACMMLTFVLGATSLGEYPASEPCEEYVEPCDIKDPGDEEKPEEPGDNVKPGDDDEPCEDPDCEDPDCEDPDCEDPVNKDPIDKGPDNNNGELGTADDTPTGNTPTDNAPTGNTPTGNTPVVKTPVNKGIEGGVASIAKTSGDLSDTGDGFGTQTPALEPLGNSMMLSTTPLPSGIDWSGDDSAIYSFVDDDPIEITFDVSKNTVGILTIEDGINVELNFINGDTFNGDIIIEENAKVTFIIPTGLVTVNGDIESDETIIGLIKDGSGTLNLAGNVKFVSADYCIDIMEGDLWLTGNDVDLKGATSEGEGLYARGDNHITLNGGEMKIGGITLNPDSSLEIKSGDITIVRHIDSDKGNVTISGGDTTINGSIGDSNPLGYRAGEVTIGGGTVTIGNGIFAVGDVTISGGDTTITGDIDSGGDVKISGGETTITGDINSGGDVKISGGTVKISIGDIFAFIDVNISSGTVEIGTGIILVSNGNVNISGGALKINEGSIFVLEGDVDISDGTVTLSDGYIVADGDVTISGGTVNITTKSTTEAAIEASSIYLKGGFGSLSSESDNVVEALSTTTLHVDDTLTVWDSATRALVGISADNTRFVVAGTTQGVKAVGFAVFTVTVVGGTLQDGETPTSGDFVANSTVHITANTPPTGQRFAGWTLTTDPAITPPLAPTAPGTLSDQDIAFIMPFANVTATARFEPLPEAPGVHVITVSHTGNGVIRTSANSAVQGTVITLTAIPDSGNQFVRWEVISGGITLSATTMSEATASATFVMPNNDVAVRAVFEPIAGTTPTSPKMGDISTGISAGVLLAFMAVGTGGVTFARIKTVYSKRKK
jgi:formylmethanofuran dehydrogenase subunit C